jgi:hypothetical protein
MPSEQRGLCRRDRLRTKKQIEELHVDEDPLAAGPDILEHPAGDQGVEPVRGSGSGNPTSLDNIRDPTVRLLEKDSEQVQIY